MPKQESSLIGAAELMGAPVLEASVLQRAQELFAQLVQACESLPSQNELGRVFSEDRKKALRERYKTGKVALQKVLRQARELPQGWAGAVLTQGRPVVWMNPEDPGNTQQLRQLNQSLHEQWPALLRSRWVLCMESQFMENSTAGLRAWKDAIHTVGVHLWDAQSSLLHDWVQMAREQSQPKATDDEQRQAQQHTASILRVWQQAGGDVNVADWERGHSPLWDMLIDRQRDDAIDWGRLEELAVSLIAATNNAVVVPKGSSSVVGLALEEETLTPVIAWALEQQQSFLFKPLKSNEDEDRRCPIAILLENPMGSHWDASLHLLKKALREKPPAKRLAAAKALLGNVRKRQGQVRGPSEAVLNIVETTFAQVEQEVLSEALRRKTSTVPNPTAKTSQGEGGQDVPKRRVPRL